MKRHWLIVVGLILALALVGCGGDSANDGGNAATNGGDSGETETVSAGDPEAGEVLFDQVCIACHGPGGEGIEGLGKPFTTSEFIPAQSDQELLEFIKQGRPVGHPDNTTGVDMPPKGGNPALTDEQILDIIAYIRTVHE
ncbi:MAG: c-type cytochrome [Anaerolineae bacterium]|nr:c-type cytochrome [Anaerolineae bacterium]